MCERQGIWRINGMVSAKGKAMREDTLLGLLRKTGRT